MPVTHFIVIFAALPWSGNEPAMSLSLPVYILFKLQGLISHVT